jgi:uridine kinase
LENGPALSVRNYLKKDQIAIVLFEKLSVYKMVFVCGLMVLSNSIRKLTYKTSLFLSNDNEKRIGKVCYPLSLCCMNIVSTLSVKESNYS